MTDKTGKSGRSSNTLNSNVKAGKSPSICSMGEPSKPNPGGERNNDKTYSLTVETQWTVSSRIPLNRYQESMILKYLVAECLSKGFLGTESFLYMFYLLERISRGQSIREIRDIRERHVCLYAYTILHYFPSFLEFSREDCELKEFLLNFEGPVRFDSRVLGSMISWNPRRFLKIETVPLEKLIERSGLSKRYSSYCKGYGEGGSLSRRKKRTSYSAELDGEDEDRPKPFDGFGQSFVIQLIQVLNKIGKEHPGISIL